MADSPKLRTFVNDSILNIKPGEKLSLRIEDLPDWLIEKISEGEMDPGLKQLNNEDDIACKKYCDVIKSKASPSM